MFHKCKHFFVIRVQVNVTQLIVKLLLVAIYSIGKKTELYARQQKKEGINFTWR